MKLLVSQTDALWGIPWCGRTAFFYTIYLLCQLCNWRTQHCLSQPWLWMHQSSSSWGDRGTAK